MEALNVVKQMVEDGCISQEVAEKYCPELAKSDDKIREDIIVYLKSLDDNFVGTKQMDSWIAYLERQGGKKPWSEEDGRHIRFLIGCLEVCVRGAVIKMTPSTAQKYIKWLESLYPQPTWKPSNEQMHYLSWIANVKLGDSVVEQEVSKHLNELYQDLKKLKG